MLEHLAEQVYNIATDELPDIFFVLQRVTHIRQSPQRFFLMIWVSVFGRVDQITDQAVFEQLDGVPLRIGRNVGCQPEHLFYHVAGSQTEDVL